MPDGVPAVKSPPWTAEKEQRLRVLHAEGKTRTEMAQELGFADRGAVCGKLNRLGLTGTGPRAQAARIQTARFERQPNGTTSDWTEERDRRLIQLWPDWTISISNLAQELCMSRSSVSNRARRLVREGRIQPRTRVLTGHQRSTKNRNNAFAYQVKSKTPIAPAFTSLDPEPVTPLRQRCSLMNLTDKNCHWPIGDPALADFFFCGGKSVSGLPYCGYHARVAYQPRKQLP